MSIFGIVLLAMGGLLVFAVATGQSARPPKPRPPALRRPPPGPIYYGVVDDHRHHHPTADETMYFEERASDGCDDS